MTSHLGYHTELNIDDTASFTFSMYFSDFWTYAHHFRKESEKFLKITIITTEKKQNNPT